MSKTIPVGVEVGVARLGDSALKRDLCPARPRPRQIEQSIFDAGAQLEQSSERPARSQGQLAHQFRVTIQYPIGNFIHKPIIRRGHSVPAFKLAQEFSNLPALFWGHCLDFIHHLPCRHGCILHKIRAGTSHGQPPYFGGGGMESATQRKPIQKSRVLGTYINRGR